MWGKRGFFVIEQNCLVRIVAAIGMMILLLTLTWEKLGVVVSYEINKVYITQVLCENRDQPELQCKGQCALSKQLQAQESPDPVAPPLTFDEKPIQQIVSFPVLMCCRQHPADGRTLLAQGTPLHDRDVVMGIFHPPRYMISK